MPALNNQIQLFDVTEAPDPRDVHGTIDIHSYDFYLVGLSGGKDSICCVLNLLEQGVPRSKIELWHHRVDGAPGEPRVFDWAITDAYVEAFAKAMDIPLYYSWKEQGIIGEILRTNERTKPISFETPDKGVMTTGGTRGELSTRRMWPAVSPDLGKRFCSSYSKIDVGARAITSQTRFCGKRTVFITGERAAESSNRSKYLRFEPHRTDRRNGRLARHVDHYRPVLDWSEQEIWDCMKRWGVRPHPAYEFVGRCSCAFCIFSSANQLATLRDIDPQGFNQMATLEIDLNHTMKHGRSLHEVADSGTSYAQTADPKVVALIMSTEYNQPILVDSEDWQLPAGAFGENAGPL